MVERFRFGHRGNLVEYCVRNENKDSVEFLLGQGVKVEVYGRPILLMAELCEASNDIKALLTKYGATINFEEEEAESEVEWRDQTLK